MAGKKWTAEEIKYLVNNFEDKTCGEIAKGVGRTEKSIQHKIDQLGLSRDKLCVGSVIKDWQIKDIFSIHNGHQNISYCVIKSTQGDPEMRTTRLTQLRNKKIAFPHAGRPDLKERNKTHGLSYTRIFKIWYGMKNRCKSSDNYREVEVCGEWKDDVERFYKWSIANGYSEEDDSLTLDRIDPSGDYEPDNCRWVDWHTQQRNKANSKGNFLINSFGEDKYPSEWVRDERCVVLLNTLLWRIKNGWGPEKAITQPSERKRKLGLKNWLNLNHPKIYEEYQNISATVQ